MKKDWMPKEEKTARLRTPEHKEQTDDRSVDSGPSPSGLTGLHRSVGNQAVQRILAQRSGDGGTELDDETAGRIDQARGGGQALDSAVQAQMGESMGYDFSGVRVHTSPEADALNRQLSAKAFTTGQDVFFRQGTYDPNSSGGQELIAHELTHVVQQGTGAVHSGGRMTVNAPGDAYEQQADASARQVTGANASVQRQDEPMEEDVVGQPSFKEEEIQLQPEEEEEWREEELIQPNAIQRRGAEPEEDVFQTQPMEEEEEEEEPEEEGREEELIQPKAIQRQEEALGEEI